MNAVQRKHCGFVHAFQPSPSWQYACLIATTIHHVKVLGRKGCMVAPLFTPSFAGRTMARSVHPILSMSATTQEHSMMKRTLGYRRDSDGTISIIDVVEIQKGELWADGASPLTATDETTELKGWPDEGPARIYTTDGGVEVIVPERS